MWIRIQSLELFAHHGVYDEERKTGNRFEVDVEVRVPETFGIRDEIEATLDYTRIAGIVSDVSNSATYKLLERFCDDICSAVFALDEAIAEAVVRIRKLAPPMAAEVKSVEVERRIVR